MKQQLSQPKMLYLYLCRRPISGFVSFVVLWNTFDGEFRKYFLVHCFGVWFGQMVSHFYRHLEMLKLRYGMIWLSAVYYYLYDENVIRKQGDIKSAPHKQVRFVVFNKIKFKTKRIRWKWMIQTNVLNFTFHIHTKYNMIEWIMPTHNICWADIVWFLVYCDYCLCWQK